MRGTPRDAHREQEALRAAADRLLAGTPLRSTSGKLTATELISESGLRRDVVYRHHRDLVQAFQARAKAQRSTPDAMTDLAEKYDTQPAELARTKQNLAAARETTAVLRRVIAELALELHQARDDLEAATSVIRLSPGNRRTPG